jgi:hypothetical protein
MASARVPASEARAAADSAARRRASTSAGWGCDEREWEGEAEEGVR